MIAAAQRVVHKTFLQPEPTRIHASAFLHVAAQQPADPTPSVWYETGPGAPEWLIDFIGTGHVVPSSDGWVHIGSAVCSLGRLVWHVYARPIKKGDDQ